MNTIKYHLELFKQYVVRKFNNLKTRNFHQMLHIFDYITHYGCPMNYDGSRGETFGKLKTKYNEYGLLALLFL